MFYLDVTLLSLKVLETETNGRKREGLLTIADLTALIRTPFNALEILGEKLRYILEARHIFRVDGHQSSGALPNSCA